MVPNTFGRDNAFTLPSFDSGILMCVGKSHEVVRKGFRESNRLKKEVP